MSAKVLLRWHVLAVFCGGFFGTLGRYFLSLAIQGILGKDWPYDILLINITGAFLLALFTILADAGVWFGPTRRLFVNVGFLGAYTTFSSLALGDILLLSKGALLPAFVYVLASLLGGMVAVLLGIWLGLGMVRRMKQRPVEPALEVSTNEHVDLQDDLLLTNEEI